LVWASLLELDSTRRRRLLETFTANDRTEALRADVRRAEGEAVGAFVGPELMDILFRRFEPKGVSKADVRRLAAINYTPSQFDLS
tara:strand:+ start:654 stop:908 length:255 start_codon:yes stop_codon:yes gene_type:complete